MPKANTIYIARCFQCCLLEGSFATIVEFSDAFKKEGSATSSFSTVPSAPWERWILFILQFIFTLTSIRYDVLYGSSEPCRTATDEGTEYPCTVVVAIVSGRFSTTQHHNSVTLVMLSDLLFLFRLVHGCVVWEMMKPTISTTTITTTSNCHHQFGTTQYSSKGFVTSSFLLNLAGFARNKMRPSVID